MYSENLFIDSDLKLELLEANRLRIKGNPLWSTASIIVIFLNASIRDHPLRYSIKTINQKYQRSKIMIYPDFPSHAKPNTQFDTKSRMKQKS